ncbi:hypothetical protein V7138_22740 [Bacillus sp. JJ1533]
MKRTASTKAPHPVALSTLARPCASKFQGGAALSTGAYAVNT